MTQTPSVGQAVQHGGKTGTITALVGSGVNIVWGDGSTTIVASTDGWSWDGDAEIWGYADSTGYMKKQDDE